MKAKRSKQYRKLMQQYGLVFSFREPYQILVDAQMIQDAVASKMDLSKGLERTLHGQIKPMVTQCSIRHLYTLPSGTSTTHKNACIELAKQLERRRCNHHTLEEPLSTLACFKDVIDSKGLSTNKHRYVVATQDEDVKEWCQSVRGVPIVYVYRSVMLMKHMADSSKDVRLGVEREKLRAGIKPRLQKRKRSELDGADQNPTAAGGGAVDDERKKRKIKGPKGPNSLSVKKAKKKDVTKEGAASAASDPHSTPSRAPGVVIEAPEQTGKTKRKRKRKHKSIQLLSNEVEAQSSGD